jgi:hypothetical protein
MALYDKDPFPGIDYSRYQDWEKITTPDGQTYFVVPGNAGYVFDPVASNATGRKVFRRNPKGEIEQAQKAEAERQAALEQQMFNQSPAGQLIPVVGQAGGTIGGLYAAKELFGPAASANVVTEAATQGALSSAPGAVTGTGAFLPGGTSMATAEMPTSISNFAGSATPYLGAAGAAYGGYNALQGIKKGDPVQAGMGGLGAGLGINAMGYALGPWGWAAMAGAPIVASMLNGAFDQKSTKEIEADRWSAAGASPELAEKMYGYDYFTGTEGQKSRDEKFLTPDAIRVNPDNYNNVADWDEWSKSEQDEFLTAMLGAGKVSERKGGIYYDDDFAKAKADEIRRRRSVNAMTEGATGGR